VKAAVYTGRAGGQHLGRVIVTGGSGSLQQATGNSRSWDQDMPSGSQVSTQVVSENFDQSVLRPEDRAMGMR